MKTQAILIAAIALLLGTEAALIKPAPGTVAYPKIPGTNTRKVLPNLSNYILYINNGHTGYLLEDFYTLQLYLDSNNAPKINPTSIHLDILPLTKCKF
jgi:hypothetical protein